MARRPVPPALVPANLSPKEKQEAILKLERRIRDVQDFDPDSVTDRSDPRISTLEKRLESNLESIFPIGSTQHRRYSYRATKLDTAGINLVRATPIQEVRDGLRKGRDSVISHLKEIVEQFREDLGQGGVSPIGRSIRAYEGLDLHPEILRATADLYLDGHYANAIENSVKALNDLVRLKSGEARDGTGLMEFVFNPKNPVIKFNDLLDQSDQDEQKGFMMLFCGAVAGLRNPRAHKIIKDDPERALEFIAFVSLLAKMVDQAKK